MTDAYWCRDQNFRKYFQARKRHNIAPSTDVNSFYNKKYAGEYYNNLEILNQEYRKVQEVETLIKKE